MHYLYDACRCCQVLKYKCMMQRIFPWTVHEDVVTGVSSALLLHNKYGCLMQKYRLKVLKKV